MNLYNVKKKFKLLNKKHNFSPFIFFFYFAGWNFAILLPCKYRTPRVKLIDKYNYEFKMHYHHYDATALNWFTYKRYFI